MPPEVVDRSDWLDAAMMRNSEAPAVAFAALSFTDCMVYVELALDMRRLARVPDDPLLLITEGCETTWGDDCVVAFVFGVFDVDVISLATRLSVVIEDVGVD